MRSSPPRNEAGEWYRETFGHLYPLIYAHRDDESALRETERIVELLGLSGSGARVLDVCCGAGRHMAGLAGMGLDVWGVDLSRPLLGEAAKRPEAHGRIVRADMKQLPFLEGFAAVVNLFTSFGYFADDADNEKVLGEMARVLAPGGRLLLDHMNRPAVERQLGDDTREQSGVTIHQTRWVEGNRVLKRIEMETDAHGNVTLTESVRLYEPDEMASLLESSGFADVRLYGSFDGGKLTGESDRMIATAERKRE
jgi:ubiquinone/menaquinone biosynthesis C-methylase UbiE